METSVLPGSIHTVGGALGDTFSVPTETVPRRGVRLQGLAVADRAARRLSNAYILCVGLAGALALLHFVCASMLLGDGGRQASLIELSSRQLVLIERAVGLSGPPLVAARAQPLIRELERIQTAFSSNPSPFPRPLRASLPVVGSLQAELAAALDGSFEGKGSARAQRLSAAAESLRVATQRLTEQLVDTAETRHARLRWLNMVMLALTGVGMLTLAEFLVRPAVRYTQGVLRGLETAKREAEAAADARSRFTANVSHELRTPLNAIVGMSGILNRTQLSPRQQHYARIVDASARTLRALVDDVLDFSKIQADAMAIEQIEMDLVSEVEQHVTEQAVEAHRRGLELALRIDPALDGTVWGDPLRIGQCLTNLLSNAIKFTDTGHIHVEVRRGPDDEVRFQVADTGPGLSATRAVHVFEAFQQEDESTTRCYGGTGLGLSIVRRLARLMGGNAWHEPAAGGGSVFQFTARLPPATPTVRHLKLEGTVLLVGWRTTARRAIEGWLQAWGVAYVVVERYEEVSPAIRWAEADGQPPRTILVDGQSWSMADTSLLREHPQLRAAMLVMVVPLGQEYGTRDLPSLELEQVLGPITRYGLLGVLSRSGADLGAGASRLKVLLVEDNRINQEVASAILEEEGCEVVVAENGQQALQVFEAEPFDLVLMDWHMPVMDGLEATRRIRNTDSGRTVPVVALTAGSLDDAREACLPAGMDEVLGKPIEHRRLIDLLRRTRDRDRPR